ncbi:ABC transporter protein [Rutstroemia sp. NJR-2017a WRK4]|nr:ABC transporter protein [Rutstroemia sp. NJR-2017a WRK4]
MGKQNRNLLHSYSSKHEATSTEEPLLAEEDEIPKEDDEPIWTSAVATNSALEHSFHGASLQTEAFMSEITPSSASSPTECPSSAKEPLLADEEGENTETAEVDQAVQSDGVKKKPFISPEYRLAISHFTRIFSYTGRNDRLMLLAAAVASILTGITLPLMNVVFGELVGEFSAFYNPDSGETKEAFIHAINRNVIYMLCLFVVRLFLDYVAVLGFRMVSIRISATMRLAYLNSLFRQPISVLDTLPSGQTAAIITITANILQLGISEKLSMFIQSMSLTISALMIAFYYNWLLALVTCSGLIFILASYPYTVPRLVEGLKQVEEADRASSSVASEAFSSIRMITACEATDKMAKKYAAWVQESKRRGLLMSSVVAIQQAPVFFAIHARTFSLSFWFAIKLYLDHEISNVRTMIMSAFSSGVSSSSVTDPLAAF